MFVGDCKWLDSGFDGLLGSHKLAFIINLFSFSADHVKRLVHQDQGDINH